MKTKKRIQLSLMDFLLLIWFLLEYRFFFLVPLPYAIDKLNTYHTRYLELLCVLMMCLTYRRYRKKNFFYYNYIVLFLALVVFNLIFTLTRYFGASIHEVIAPFSTYLLILMYFPLSNYFRSDEHFENFKRMFLVFNIIACVLLVFQAIEYNTKHHLFLRIFEIIYRNDLQIRDGRLRITYLTTIVSVSVVISAVELISLKKHIIWNLINLVVSSTYLGYVAQTRMYIIILLLVGLYIFYFLNQNNSQFAVVFTILIGTALFVFLTIKLDVKTLLYELIEPLLNGSYKRDGSYFARLDALLHFSKAIIRHPLIGLGIIIPDRTSDFYYVIHGEHGWAVYTDVGILGTTAEFGLPMLVWFICMMARTWKKIGNQHSAQTMYSKTFFIFIMLSCISLSVFDPQRIIILPLTLALYDRAVKSNTSADSVNILKLFVSRNPDKVNI